MSIGYTAELWVDRHIIGRH